MKRRRIDSRQKHDGVQVPLAKECIQRIRKLSGDRRPLCIEFFQQVVWWWRPLGALLAEKSPFEIGKAERGFFPAFVFDRLQYAFLTGEVPELARTWLFDELLARAEGRAADYPGFTTVTPIATQISANPRWRNWREAQLTIDLGKPREKIVREATEKIDQLRKQLFAKSSLLLWGNSKGQVFEPNIFRACEFIDVKMFKLPWIGQKRKKLPWIDSVPKELPLSDPNGIEFDESVIRSAMREAFDPIV